ncbi:MAG: Zinc import ATP-binding protein ZnuC [Planctomycetota bacterium]|jgi:zinc transport system ATP-binding protein
MSDVLLTLKNVSVKLGHLEVLKNVNASLLKGRITSLVGLNGSGKSTLLRVIVREIPFGGELSFYCGHAHKTPDPQQVGYVPQKLRLEAGLPLTVRDFLGLPMQSTPIFWGINKSIESKMVSMLEKVGSTSKMLDKPVDKLSGGELQRLLLALAMEPNPELLLLDEPAAGIDFQDQEKFYMLLKEFNQKTKVTILLVSHDLGLVNSYADQVWCLHRGVIAEIGTPKEVLVKDNLQTLFGSGLKIG